MEQQIVYQREDGSFVITHNGNPYHVPNEGEFQELWAEISAKISSGELTAIPEPKEPVPEPTLEELQNMFTEAIQAHLNAFARTRNYDNILSAATYASSTAPKFRAEGQYAVEARDATWARGYEILAEVESGERPLPSLDDVLAELPVLVWPE